MNQEQSNEITRYWDWIESLPEDLKEIALRQWNEWGEGIRHIGLSITELIELGSTVDEFTKNYIMFKTGIANTQTISALTVDAEIYWHVYVSGMKRVRDELIKDGLIK